MKNYRSVAMITLVLMMIISCASESSGLLLNPARDHAQTGATAGLPDDTRVINLDHYGITVLKTRQPLDFLYNPQGYSSFRQAAAAGGYSFLVNGAYFDVSNKTYIHAGWLSAGTKLWTPLKEDAQLSCVVGYDLQADSLTVTPLQSFSALPREHWLQFQTGPLLIEQGQVDTAAVQASINGKSAHLRTLLGFDPAGYKYLLITREPVALEELANYLLTQALFQKEPVTLINLDGGSSTMLYAAGNSKLSFKRRTGLPLLVGVR